MTELQAFLQQKCPRCRKGNMFPYKTYNLLKFGDTNKQCECCGLQFEREPSFFTGAMYFSYAINVAIVVIVGVGLNSFTNLKIEYVVSIVIATSLAAVPMTYRYSRMLMMYLFGGVQYDPKL
ncbi:MAG: DUF983 domain-containing protein [Bacteroidota bacterium]|nr:DUF983 domain-containing protein [Bacteroidota bacterium]